MLAERDYQPKLKKKLKAIFPPGTKILKNDARYLQGISDLLVSYGAKCAWLEVKDSQDAPHRPNQDYYVNQINSQGGFARFIYPENEKEVISELRGWFGV